MDSNWVSAYSTDKIHLAEIAKEILADHGIAAVVLNQKDSNYLFGYIEIHVEKPNLIKAKNLLKTIES